MPELPEVETVQRGLQKELKGASIRRVKLRRRNLRTPFPRGFEKHFSGQSIKKIERRAKYLFFHLDDGSVLIAHLGMTGRFTLEASPPKSFLKHDHVVFYFDDGRVLVFNDPRRFGLMTLCKSHELAKHRLIAHLGPEPLSAAFSSPYLKRELLRRKAAIKPVIMDQKLVVGVGNIYACEALFLANIHPERPAYEVASQSQLLIRVIHKVLNQAIKAGGSTLQDFKHVSGEAGYFQHQFNVYGRDKKPCLSCGKYIAAIKQAGRSTFFCPHCQK